MTHVVGAAVLDGVTLVDKIQVKGNALTLNGMGTRKATFLKVKVYVAGLYLQALSQDANQILNSNQIKKVDLHFVHDVSASKLSNAWNESFEKNCKVNCDSLKPTLLKLNSLMEDVQSGDNLGLTFFPNHVEVSIKNKPGTQLEGAEFSKILLASWLGQNPPNSELKEGMLGLKK
jgi:hypothetical protein